MEKKTAQDVLNEFYSNRDPVLPIDVVGIANSYGIDVLRASFGGTLKDSVYGFIEKDGDKTQIVLNANNALTRRRFTVAHELGHYFLHHNGKELEYLDMRSTMSTPEETAANRFAAELLMPEEQVRREHGKLLFPTVDELARIFNVSGQSMRYRLANLKLDAFG